jgi:uncharacterized membrane protein YphA (DoxX/SURF4 family)
VKYLVWVSIAIVTLMMLMGGIIKLTGNPTALASFATLGLPASFATFIGICEIVGAFGILFHRTRTYAAGSIAIIMVGAVYYHLIHTPKAEAIPAFFVLFCCGFLVNRHGRKIID